MANFSIFRITISNYRHVIFLLLISAIKISERHNILSNSIGYLPEEQKAHEDVWIITSISLVCIILSSITEAMLFILYNGRFHPFKNIIVDIKQHQSKDISMNTFQTST